MAERELFQTSDLVPLLAERGVVLSREQVYRLVAQPPQRLSMDTLVALCDILDCTPNDLINPGWSTGKSVRPPTAEPARPAVPRRHLAVRSCAAPDNGDHSGGRAGGRAGIAAGGAASGAQPRR
jgi:hypothetical protein